MTSEALEYEPIMLFLLLVGGVLALALVLRISRERTLRLARVQRRLRSPEVSEVG
ncbi:MAG: hypothetical protein ACOYNI_05110 [Acidimicrobiia bacterium]